MYLTKEEEEILKGEHGEAKSIAMDFLVKYGEYYDAENLVPISMAITMADVAMCRPTGIKYLERLAELGAKVEVPTISLIHAIDHEFYRELNLGEDKINWELRSDEALRKMDVDVGYTCELYQLHLFPHFGSYVSIAGSNLTSFANSIIGARTNPEGPASALMSGIVGKAPKLGYMIDENRKGNVLVKVDAKLRDWSDWQALGYYVGKVLGDKYGAVPVFTGLPPDPTIDAIKGLNATLTTYGAIVMYHIVGVTSEARTLEEAFGGNKPEDKVIVTDKDLNEIYEMYRPNEGATVDAVVFGCPFLTYNEVKKIAFLLKDKKIKDDIYFLLSVGAAVKAIADKNGITEIIEKAGGRLSSGCFTFEVEQGLAKELGLKTVVTDSVKYAHYLKKNVDSVWLRVEDCVEAGVKGKL